VTGLRWGSATDVGLVRRTNQDHLLTVADLFAVADGMGGHAGGEVASRLAVEALQGAFGDGRDSPPASADLLEAMRTANRAVFEQAQADPDLRGMGTTMTAAALVVEDGEDRLAVANVGDSRAYVLSAGELTQLTEDHSVAEELVRQGQLHPTEVDVHPQRHILTRALGIQPEVDVDLWEVLPYLGDRLLLCSDGLVREMTDDQIAAVLRRLADPGEAAKELVARARANGGSDNISVVVVDVVDDDNRALTASAAVAADTETRATPPTVVHEDADAENDAPPPPATFPTLAPRTPPAAVPPRRRRLTGRVLVFVVLILLVFASAALAVVAYARGSYYVALGPPVGAAGASPLAGPDARPLVIYQGRPGGLLWFQPTLSERTTVLSSEVLPSHLPDLAKGKIVASRSAAERYVANLRDEAARAGGTTPVTQPPGATTTTARSTTVP